MPTKSSQSRSEEFPTAVIGVIGMSCEHCSARVVKALSGQEGVKEVRVDLASGMATVTFDDSKTSISKLHAALTKSGYPPVAGKSVRSG